MTRKKVEAVITDCEQCPFCDYPTLDNDVKCKKLDRSLPDEWTDHSKEQGYIPSWCPLEDAPCETCGGSGYVCARCGGKLVFAVCNHKQERIYKCSCAWNTMFNRGNPCPDCQPIDVSAIIDDEEIASQREIEEEMKNEGHPGHPENYGDSR